MRLIAVGATCLLKTIRYSIERRRCDLFVDAEHRTPLTNVDYKIENRKSEMKNSSDTHLIGHRTSDFGQKQKSYMFLYVLYGFNEWGKSDKG